LAATEAGQSARPRKRATGTTGKKKTLSLTEQVYQRLRGEILGCTLEPGQDISEAELAERFNVSKTPVREALATLRQEGLVLTYPRRGYQVAPITFGDMNELFDLRTILEVGAAELACEHITEAEIETLRDLAPSAYELGASPTIEQFIRSNRDFHLAIARAARNERLLAMLTRQILELERFFYLGAQLRDVNKETNTDHAEIVDALAARNRDEVRRLMVRHNELTRQGLFQALAASRRFGGIRL